VAWSEKPSSGATLRFALGEVRQGVAHQGMMAGRPPAACCTGRPPRARAAALVPLLLVSALPHTAGTKHSLCGGCPRRARDIKRPARAVLLPRGEGPCVGVAHGRGLRQQVPPPPRHTQGGPWPGAGEALPALLLHLGLLQGEEKVLVAGGAAAHGASPSARGPPAPAPVRAPELPPAPAPVPPEFVRQVASLNVPPASAALRLQVPPMPRGHVQAAASPIRALARHQWPAVGQGPTRVAPGALACGRAGPSGLVGGVRG